MQTIYRIENVVDGYGIFNSSDIFEVRSQDHQKSLTRYSNFKKCIYEHQTRHSHPNINDEECNLKDRLGHLPESFKTLFDGLGNTTYFGCTTLGLLVGHWLHGKSCIIDLLLSLNCFVVKVYEVPDECCYNLKLQSMFDITKAKCVRTMSLDMAHSEWVGLLMCVNLLHVMAILC